MKNFQKVMAVLAGLAAVAPAGAATAQEAGHCGQPAALTQGHFGVAGEGAAPIDEILRISRGEPAYFEFTVESETGVTIETFSNDLDPMVILFDGAGRMVRSDDDGSGTLNARLGARLEPGTYCAQIRTLADVPPPSGTLPTGYDGPVPFRLSTGLAAGAGGCANQPGLVTLEEPLAPGSAMRTWRGALPGRGAVAFTLAEPMALSLTARSAEFDTVLSLEDGFGAQVASDDDGGGGTDSYLGLGTPLEAGDYCVQVESYEGNGGAFTLTYGEWSEAADAAAAGGGMILDPCGDPEMTTQLGGALASGFPAQRFTRNLAHAAQFFAFEISEPLDLRLTATSSGVDTVLGLYDAQGAEIARNDDAEGLGTNSRIRTGGPLPAGRYCAAVSPYSGEGTGGVAFELIELTEEAILQEAYDSGEILPPESSGVFTDLGLLERNLRSDAAAGGGTHWYLFELEGESLVVADAAGLGSLSGLVLFDYEGGGLKLAESRSEPDRLDTRLVRKLGSGIYAIGVVRGEAEGGSGASSLSLQRYVRPPRDG